MNSSSREEKVKREPQAIAVQNSRIIQWILRFGATPRTEHEDHREPGSQRVKPGDQEKQGHQGGGWQDTTVQQSLLLLVPKFVLSTKRYSYSRYFLLLRTRHLLLDRFLSTFTLLLTAALLLLSPSQCPWSLCCRCFVQGPRCIFLLCHFTHFLVYFSSNRVHSFRSLAMLIQMLLFWLFLSTGSSFSLSSRFCLRKSLMSSSHLSFGLPIVLLVLYLELSSGFHSAAFFFSIFHSVMLRFSMLISISFFCVFCSSNESLHVPSCQ